MLFSLRVIVPMGSFTVIQSISDQWDYYLKQTARLVNTRFSARAITQLLHHDSANLQQKQSINILHLFPDVVHRETLKTIYVLLCGA